MGSDLLSNIIKYNMESRTHIETEPDGEHITIKIGEIHEFCVQKNNILEGIRAEQDVFDPEEYYTEQRSICEWCSKTKEKAIEIEEMLFDIADTLEQFEGNNETLQKEYPNVLSDLSEEFRIDLYEINDDIHINLHGLYKYKLRKDYIVEDALAEAEKFDAGQYINHWCDYYPDCAIRYEALIINETLQTLETIAEALKGEAR